jgi:CubicO group peptidase (beta-lactamase class C family)
MKKIMHPDAEITRRSASMQRCNAVSLIQQTRRSIVLIHYLIVKKMQTTGKILSVIFISIASTVCGQEAYYPDADWEVKKPAEVKMNAQLLDEAVQFAIRNETKTETDLRIASYKAWAREPDYRILGPMKARGGPSGVILRHGYIVAQWGDVQRVDMTFSVTKSYLSTVAGLAVDQKLIGSIDDRVNAYVWDETFAGPHHSKITWRHLLNQSSDWSGCLFDICDWADRPPKEGTIDDWKQRKLIEPGTQYEYNDVRVNLLAYTLLQVWRKPLPMVLKERVMDPIGASTTWRWYGYDNSFVNIDGIMMQSVSGGGHFGGGMFINTLDQARFGLLFLRKGKWKSQRILPEQWVHAAHQPSAPNKAYGLMWWTNEGNDLKNASSSVYYAAGFGGNYIVIDHEKDLVIVVRWLESSQLGEFIERVGKAVKQ